MKYYWINSDESIEEVSEKEFQKSQFSDMFLWNRCMYFEGKDSIRIGGDERFEISYFNKLVDKFLENEESSNNK